MAGATCDSFYRSAHSQALFNRILESFEVNSITGEIELLFNVAYEFGAHNLSKATQKSINRDEKKVDAGVKQVELEMIYRFIEQHGERVRSIIEVGPGDGYKPIQLIHWLRKNYGKHLNLNYMGIDINSAVIDLTSSAFKSHLPHDERLMSQFLAGVNFERTSLKPIPFSNKGFNIGLLLGQTLGNPKPEQRVNFLKNLRLFLPHNSFVLAGMYMKPPDSLIPKIVEIYRSEENRKLMLASLDAMGLTDKGRLEVRWNNDKNDIEGIFVVEQDISIQASPSGNRPALNIPAGNEILVFRSHRFTESEIKKMFQLAGYQIPAIEISKELNYALVKVGI